MVLKEHEQQSKKGGFKFEVILGLVLLVVANLVLAVWKPLSKVDPESLPAAHTWVWWAAKEFQEQQFAPKVVLLGSSLVMHPISRADADYMGIDLDYVKHHRSVYMEELLRNKLHANGNCYNFSLPGGMVSDDYIVTAALLEGKRKPQVIVLGLSLRDFIDNGVRCAGATPAFRYLKRYVEIDDILDIAMPQIWQRMDYLVGNTMYLWGKKLDLQVVLSQKCKETAGDFCAKNFPVCRLASADLSRNLPSNLRSEVEEGMMIVKSKQPYSYEDNSPEYKKRYRTANESMFGIQSKFLERLLTLAKERDIAVVLVNMPLTADNKKLMPAGAYDKYLALLRQTAQQREIPFVDLDGKNQFDQTNFYDTSHMNGSGGKKLVDEIVNALASDQQVLARLGGTSQLAGNSQAH